MSKKEELKELIWYIAANHPKRLMQTKLWKLCFFSEADFFERFDERLTKTTYIKNNYGPTPDWKLAKQALEELIKEGSLVLVDDEYIRAGEKNLKHLDAKKQQSIDNTCSKYAELNVNEIVHLSHQDPAYVMGEHNRPIKFENVHYRSDEEDVYKDEVTLELNKKQRSGLSALAAI